MSRSLHNSPAATSVPLVNQQFALDLYSNLISANTIPSSQNVFFSPFSVLAALAVLNVGAKGKTRDQILTGTRLKNLGDVGKIDSAFKDLFDKLDIHTQGEKAAKVPQTKKEIRDAEWIRYPAYLALANRIYLQKDTKVKPGFGSTLKSSYNTTFGLVDFAGNPDGAKNEINQWVENVTNNRINNLFSSMSTDVKLALVSAIYFKAEWEDHFYEDNTKEENFSASGKNVKAQFMKRTDDDALYAEFPNLDAAVLKKFYAGNSASMLVILPNKKNGLADLERKLTASVFDKSKYSEFQVDISLPKFKIETDYKLNDALQKLGITDAFSRNADFTGLSDSRLFVSEAVHKAFVEVNEKGTEAAAATGAKIMDMSSVEFLEDRKRVFKADHPFLFVIQHEETGAVLFLGRVANPTA